MNELDLTLPTPAENLACDEALLDACEAGRPGPVLRFWESPEYFVVVGYSNQIATEVNVDACRAAGVPILRRCTGGGTVVQGPGCLNYALILPIEMEGERPREPSGTAARGDARPPRPLQGVVETNRYIMQRHRDALNRLLQSPAIPPGAVASPLRGSGQRAVMCAPGEGEVRVPNARPTITFDGHTDLAYNGRKFSGNSQRRKRTHLLFHGTFLLDFDLQRISELLRHPSREPGYRARRSHAEFLTNLGLPAATVQAALNQVWQTTGAVAEFPRDRIGQLVATKYATKEWTWKF